MVVRHYWPCFIPQSISLVIGTILQACFEWGLGFLATGVDIQQRPENQRLWAPEPPMKDDPQHLPPRFFSTDAYYHYGCCTDWKQARTLRVQVQRFFRRRVGEQRGSSASFDIKAQIMPIRGQGCKFKWVLWTGPASSRDLNGCL